MLKAKEAATNLTYLFPDSPQNEAMEWPGTPIGKSNTVTRTKSRTAAYDKTVDDKPGRREELMGIVVRYLSGPGKTSEIFSHDVVVHGIRVRAFTNSPHLAEFWKVNWYGVDEWKKYTGNAAAEKPQVWVYAFGGVQGEPEAAYYSHSSNTIIFFNTSYYGQLKSWVLGAVGRVLAREYGIHSIHGACVEKDKKGILYIAPTGTGKSTSSYGLMGYPNARFHSDDWVYIRYAYTVKDGKKFSPAAITTEKGVVAKGYECFRWLQDHRGASGTVAGFGLQGQTVEYSLGEIDHSVPVEAYAYISEKVFYLRCNLVESFPQSAYSILQAHLENVPDVLPSLLKENEEALENSVKTLKDSKVDFIRKYFEKMNPAEVKETLARLFAFDNARAMLDITKVFNADQVFVNPLEPVKLSTVMLLKRNFNEDLVIETLSEDKFMERLLIGETPQGKREIAYNAYRAVDDAKESAFVKAIEARRDASKQTLYHAFLAGEDAPVTLLEEFELFRVMYKACACYDLNTILQKDPQIRDRREAVETTIKVIAKAMETKDSRLCHTVADYRKFIG